MKKIFTSYWAMCDRIYRWDVRMAAMAMPFVIPIVLLLQIAEKLTK